jgi:hypothetical protein
MTAAPVTSIRVIEDIPCVTGLERFPVMDGLVFDNALEGPDGGEVTEPSNATFTHLAIEPFIGVNFHHWQTLGQEANGKARKAAHAAA